MHDLVPVAVLDSAYDLLEEATGLIFGHAASLNNVLEELAASELNDHYDIGGRRDDFIELDDVWVTEELQVLDFALHSAAHVHRRNLPSIDDFHGDTVSRQRVCGNYGSKKRGRQDGWWHEHGEAWARQDSGFSLPLAYHSRFTFPKLPVPNVCCSVYCPMRTGCFVEP